MGAAARSCQGGDGYMALVGGINGPVVSAAPFLRALADAGAPLGERTEMIRRS